MNPSKKFVISKIFQNKDIIFVCYNKGYHFWYILKYLYFKIKFISPFPYIQRKLNTMAI